MDDLKEILAAATPGPWDVDPHGVGDCMGDVWLGEDVRVCENATSEDAHLIAMAPDLAAEVLRLRAEVERLRKALEDIADGVGETSLSKIGRFAPAIARAALKGTE